MAKEQLVSVESAGGPFSLVITADVMAPSPYSRFFAENMPRLDGLDVADLGTGCAIQAIVALRQGARRVFLLDNNEAAVDIAQRNAELNGFGDRVVVTEPGDMLHPLGKNKVDVIVCNPASL